MDVLYKDENNNLKHILCNDHRPNPAFINEFQTSQFTLKLLSIEIIEKNLDSYYVEDGWLFVLFHVEIRNNTNEIIEIYKDDFNVCLNNNDIYEIEDNFNIQYQLNDLLVLKPLETLKGNYICIIDKKIKKLDFHYTEYFDEEYFKQYHLRYKLEQSV